jgi:large subunit ribosomal protein L3
VSEETLKTETVESRKDGVASKRAPASLRVIFGQKVGMTQVFNNKNNRLYGVTVVKAGPCKILGVKSASGPDGYNAVQIAYGERKEKNISKANLGQFKKVSVSPARWIREVRLVDVAGFEPGQEVVLEGMFKPGDYVDVQATDKGKGFAGAMKRHGFHGLPASHGASDKQRSPGSIASRRSLGRVLPGQRMAGHMGNESATVQKIEVIQVDFAQHLVYLYGSVPGPKHGFVKVFETVKSRKFHLEPVKSMIKKDKMGNIINVKKPTAVKK